MSVGKEVVDQAVQYGKNVIKTKAKALVTTILTSPVFYIVLAIVLLLIIIISAFMIDYDINNGIPSTSAGYSNVGQSNFSGNTDIVEIAKGLHEFIRTNQYAYSCTHNVNQGNR